MTTRSSRVPTSTVEEPGTVETGVKTEVSSGSSGPSGTTSGGGGGGVGATGGAVGPTGGGGGGSTPSPTITALPNDAVRVGGGVGGVVGLVMFVFAFVLFG